MAGPESDEIRDDELRAELTDSQWKQCVAAWRETNRIGWGLSLREIAEKKGFMPAEIKSNSDAKDLPEIPGFEIEEEIARGAMGTVYRARQISLGRTLALKILNRRLAESKQYVRRFMREARLAARLDHPNIVRVFLADEAPGICYLAMEYVDGQPLSAILQRGKRIGEERAFALISEIASALEHAHERGVLHRDIKPSNILIDVDGRAKLTDLGLAKEIDGADSLQSEGRTVGTPSYMSPELCRGRDNVDARSDIYSLGATLYHMLTGAPPYEGATRREIMEKAATGTFAHVRDRNPDVSTGVAAIVHKMLARNPAARYQSASELLDAIRAWKRGEEIEYVAPPASEPVYRPLWRRRTTKIAAAAILLVAIGVIIFLAARPVKETPASLFGRATSLAAAGDFEGALAAYNKLATLFPDSLEAVDAANLAARWRIDRDASALLKEARRLFEEGDYSAAVATLARLKEELPTSSLIPEAERLAVEFSANAYAALMERAGAAFEREDWQTAGSAAEEALRFDPDAEVAARLARLSAFNILRSDGEAALADVKKPEALDYFRRAAALEQTPEILALISSLEEELGALGIARDIIVEIGEAEHIDWAVDENRLERGSEAAGVIKQAIHSPAEFGIDRTHVRPALLRLLHALDDPDALDSLVRIAQSPPEYPDMAGEPEPHYAIESLGMLGTIGLPALVQILRNDDIDRAVWSAEALALTGEAAAQPLFEVVLEDDERLAGAAMESLDRLGPPAAGWLTVLLTDPREEIADRARSALISAGPAALDGMMDVLRELDRAGLDAATRVVVEMGAEAAPELLRIYAARPGLPRFVIERAFGYLSDNELAPALLEGTRSGDAAVRNSALEIIGLVGARRIIPHLVKEAGEAGRLSASHEAIITRLGEAAWREIQNAFVSRNPDERRGGEIALAGMRERGMPLLAAIASDSTRDRDDRLRALDFLGRSGVAAVPHLLEIGSKDDGAVSERAVQMVLAFGDEALPYLMEARRHRSGAIRLQAVNLIWRARGAFALPDLVEMLRDSEDAIRLTVVGYIAQERDERYVDNIEPLLRDRSTDVRYAAVNALVRIDTTRAANALVRSMAVRPPIDLAELKGVIAGMGARAMPPLREAFYNRDFPARQHVLEIIGMIGGGEAVDLLMVALDDTYLEVRQTAAIQLGRLGARRAVPSLVRRLRMEIRADVRTAIVWALGEIGDPEYWTSVRYVIDRMSRDTSLGVMLAAVEALGKIWTIEARTALADAARNHQNSTVRRAADRELRLRGYLYRTY